MLFMCSRIFTLLAILGYRFVYVSNVQLKTWDLAMPCREEKSYISRYAYYPKWRKKTRPMSCNIQIHYAVIECQARSWDDKDVSNCQDTAYIQNMGYSYSIKYIPLLEENVNPFHHVFYDTYHCVRLKSVTLKSVTLPMPLIKWNTKI